MVGKDSGCDTSEDGSAVQNGDYVECDVSVGMEEGGEVGWEVEKGKV